MLSVGPSRFKGLCEYLHVSNPYGPHCSFYYFYDAESIQIGFNSNGFFLPIKIENVYIEDNIVEI